MDWQKEWEGPLDLRGAMKRTAGAEKVTKRISKRGSHFNPWLLISSFIKPGEDFPGEPVVKTPCFQCRGCGFDSWLGKFPVLCNTATKKKKKKKRKNNNNKKSQVSGKANRSYFPGTEG